MFQETNGVAASRVILKVQGCEIALQRFVLFRLRFGLRLLLLLREGGLNCTNRRSSGFGCLRCGRRRRGLSGRQCLLLQEPGSGFGRLVLLPDERRDEADRGECDGYPSCTIHSSFRKRASFVVALRPPGWNRVVSRAAPGMAAQNPFQTKPCPDH